MVGGRKERVEGGGVEEDVRMGCVLEVRGSREMYLTECVRRVASENGPVKVLP